MSAANSLVGTQSGDSVGSTYNLYALPNGNYVVASPSWANGSTAGAGAVTWVNGSNGHTLDGNNTVSTSNSLVGTNTGDQIGSNGITILPNGNYIVQSLWWNTSTGASTLGNANGGTVGELSSSNSFVGSAQYEYFGVTSLAKTGSDYFVSDLFFSEVAPGSGATGVMSPLRGVVIAGGGGHFEDTGNGDFLLSTTVAVGGFANGRVVVGILDPNQFTYARASSTDMTIASSLITDTLAKGTNVILQANNDITVNSPIVVNNSSGNGGSLTLDAGRSILINANITTDNGNLTLLANAPLSAGVVDAQRLAGDAVITMATGTTIDTGTGALAMQLSGDTAKTNHQAGNITLTNIDPSSILIENLGGGDVVLNGSLSATGTGSSIVIATLADFVNNAGANALDPGPGRFVVYSQSPLTDTFDGLNGLPYYNTPFDPFDRNEKGWYWYAEDGHAETLWDAAAARR